MTTGEIIIAIAGAIGLAEILKAVVDKLLSKRRDKTKNDNDEFSVLKKRIGFAEMEVNRLNRQQIENSRRISRMYTFMADMTKQTCAKKDCKMRDLIAIDFDSIENGDLDDTDLFENIETEDTDDNTEQ